MKHIECVDVDLDNVVTMAASREAFESALMERLAEAEQRYSENKQQLPASDAGFIHMYLPMLPQSHITYTKCRMYIHQAYTSHAQLVLR